MKKFDFNKKNMLLADTLYMDINLFYSLLFHLYLLADTNITKETYAEITIMIYRIYQFCLPLRRLIPQMSSPAKNHLKCLSLKRLPRGKTLVMST